MVKPTNLNLEKNSVVEKNGDILLADKLMQSKWVSADGEWAEFLANYNDYDVEVEYPTEGCVVVNGTDLSEINSNKFVVESGNIVMIKKENF